jgi:hypothetical protein
MRFAWRATLWVAPTAFFDNSLGAHFRAPCRKIALAEKPVFWQKMGFCACLSSTDSNRGILVFFLLEHSDLLLSGFLT